MQDDEVSTKAKALVAKWKELVQKEEEDEDDSQGYDDSESDPSESDCPTR